MRRITRVLSGFALVAVMFVSLGNMVMAKTYTLSEILAELHQRDNWENTYIFEGGEDEEFPFPHTGAGPFFAPGDCIVSDIPGVYLLTSNPEMDNLKKVRSLLATGHSFTFNEMDGMVGDTIGEGAPVLTSIYYANCEFPGTYTLYDTYTENSEHGLFQSIHIVSQEDEKAVRMLSNEYDEAELGVRSGKTPHTPAKSYRGYIIHPYYSVDGTIIAYQIRFKTYDDVEPNAEQYYAEKAALRNAQTERELFDAAYYAENNPDVVATVGLDSEALWQHYMIFGCVEGRKAYAQKAALRNAQTERELFDAAYYAENNPDVVAAVGLDSEALWQHYMIFGRVEGRKAHPE